MYLYGGKLTTHRQMGEETVNLLASSLNVPRHCKTDIRPLPDAVDIASNTDQNQELQPNLDTERLIKRYGEGYRAIQDFISQDATLAKPITPSVPFTQAELLYAYWGEMAMTLDDILWRRTLIGWTLGQGVDIAFQIAQCLGEKYNWNQTKITAEVEAYREHIRWLNFNL